MNDISSMIKIIDYMALGKPILQIDPKKGALYSDDRYRVRYFGNKLFGLLDHPEEGRRVGEFGRRLVEKELTWEYSVGNLLAAYEKVFSKSNGTCALQKLVNQTARARCKRMLPGLEDEATRFNSHFSIQRPRMDYGDAAVCCYANLAAQGNHPGGRWLDRRDSGNGTAVRLEGSHIDLDEEPRALGRPKSCVRA
jgi:hypothetical protein